MMVQVGHAERRSKAGFFLVALDAAGLAGNFCGADQVKARDRVEPTGGREAADHAMTARADIDTNTTFQ